MQLVLIFLAAVLLLLGIIFTGVSIGVERASDRKRSDCTVHIYAKVVDIQKKRVGGRRIGDMPVISWFPVYEYKVDGVDYRKVSAVGTSKPEVEIGQTVDIYYNPAVPQDFYVGGSATGQMAVIFRAIGIFLLVTGVMIAGILFYLFTVKK